MRACAHPPGLISLTAPRCADSQFYADASEMNSGALQMLLTGRLLWLER